MILKKFKNIWYICFGKWEPVGFISKEFQSIDPTTNAIRKSYNIVIWFLENSKTGARKYEVLGFTTPNQLKAFPLYKDCEIWKKTGIKPRFYKDLVSEKLKSKS